MEGEASVLVQRAGTLHALEARLFAVLASTRLPGIHIRHSQCHAAYFKVTRLFCVSEFQTAEDEPTG